MNKLAILRHSGELVRIHKEFSQLTPTIYDVSLIYPTHKGAGAIFVVNENDLIFLTKKQLRSPLFQLVITE
jgi:hypothetical protein